MHGVNAVCPDPTASKRDDSNGRAETGGYSRCGASGIRAAASFEDVLLYWDQKGW